MALRSLTAGPEGNLAKQEGLASKRASHKHWNVTVRDGKQSTGKHRFEQMLQSLGNTQQM